MPINYYANVDLNKNQLQNARIDNHATDAAAGTGVSGQIYYNTTDGELKVWTTQWESIGSGEVLSVGTGNSTYVNMANTGTSTEPVLVASLSATGTPTSSKYLRGDNQWVIPPNDNDNTTYDLNAGGTSNGTAKINLVAGGSGSGTDSVIIKGTGGVSVTQSGGEIVVNAASATGGTVTSVSGGTGISITGGTTITPTVNIDYSGSDNFVLEAGTATIDAADSIIFNDASNSTVKRTLVSALPFTNFSGFTVNSDSGSIAVGSGDTVTFAGSGVAGKAGIDTSESGGTVSFALDLNEITTVTSMASSEFLVGVNGSGNNEKMKISDLHLNQLGSPTSNVSFNSKKITGLAPGTAGTDAVNFTQLQNAITGALSFKGDFNAQSGAITGGGNLTTGGSRVALTVGDYYIVSTAGSFFGSEALDVGDQVIAVEAAAAGSSVVGDFAIIQGDEGVTKLSATFGNFLSGTSVSNADGSVNLGTINLNATGTKNSTTFLRGDNTFAVPPNTTYGVMTATTLGLGKLRYSTEQSVGANSASATAGRTYGVQMDSSDRLVVNVPWVDTNSNTQRAAGTGLSLSGNTINANVDGTNSITPNASSSTSSRTYKIQVDGSDNLVVNVPWVNTNTQTVSSVAAQAGTTSSGSPITVSPTTGAVKVKSNAYNGGSNVGHVPSGGVANKYLDGAGNWVDPFAVRTGTVFVGKTAGTTSSISYPSGITGAPMIQLYDIITGETVFADVTRGSGSFTVTFGTAPPNNVHALITYIKPFDQ